MAAIIVYCIWGSGEVQPWDSSSFRTRNRLDGSFFGCEPKTRNNILKITVFVGVNVIFLLLITYI